ncbi:MAG: hypothetical protein B6U89_00495 [Desulfurococcales archaeon ex4484_58]|nr:MAG: hypothetical protein B6U89_00495 [Desulfurococcales archaeon ex4484_58]
MAEELPESLKMKLLKKWMSEQRRVKEKESSVDPEKIVWEKLVDDRARELMSKAKHLYPDRYRYVIDILYRLIIEGSIKELDGYTTLLILHRLGVPVKPDLKIKFVKRGKEVDFKEYVE